MLRNLIDYIFDSHAELAAEVSWVDLPEAEPPYSCCAGVLAPSLCSMDAAGRFATVLSAEDAEAAADGLLQDPIQKRLLFDLNPNGNGNGTVGGGGGGGNSSVGGAAGGAAGAATPSTMAAATTTATSSAVSPCA